MEQEELKVEKTGGSNCVDSVFMNEVLTNKMKLKYIVDTNDIC